MSRIAMPLSPLAHALLEKHRSEPGRPRFLISVLGSMFRPEDLERLDGAYQELEATGLVEEAGEARFFGRHFSLYQLAKGGPGASGETP